MTQTIAPVSRPVERQRPEITDTVMDELTTGVLTSALASGTANFTSFDLAKFPYTLELGSEWTHASNIQASLTCLNLSNNFLVLLPDCIGGLQSLIVLDVSHNRLVALPHSLFSLPKLEALNLSHNNLELLGRQISQLRSLKQLNVHRNPLKELPHTIGQLKQLVDLGLGHLPDVKRLPPSLGLLKPTLKSLWFRGNNDFENVPQHLLMNPQAVLEELLKQMPRSIVACLL